MNGHILDQEFLLFLTDNFVYKKNFRCQNSVLGAESLIEYLSDLLNECCRSGTYLYKMFTVMRCAGANLKNIYVSFIS